MDDLDLKEIVKLIGDFILKQLNLDILPEESPFKICFGKLVWFQYVDKTIFGDSKSQNYYLNIPLELDETLNQNEIWVRPIRPYSFTEISFESIKFLNDK